MGFKITVGFFSIDAASLSPVKGNFNTFLDKSLLHAVDLSHAYVQGGCHHFVGRTFHLILALIAPE